MLAALVAEALGLKGSVVGARSFTAVVHRLSCVSCGALLDQGSVLVPCTAGRFLSTTSPGKSSFDLLIKGQCIYRKVLDSSYQVYLCNQNPDKREKLPARQTLPVPYSSSSPSLHHHAPDLTARGHFFKGNCMSLQSYSVHCSSLFCLTLVVRITCIAACSGRTFALSLCESVA